jgi:T4-like virus Myoviridae tail sheath stabiliser
VDYFYDEQIRRYILQFIRIFADTKIELPPDENGTKVQKRVPIVYGDMSRMVAQILRDNSQNTAMQAPAMAAYISSMDLAADRRQDTMNVRKARAVERAWDPQTGTYSADAGNKYTVESYMPVPYNLTMKLDIWTTNTTDKLQILEQILVIFNPSVQLQTHDNPLDWSTIFEVELTDVAWSSRGVPQGAQSENDFATLTFKVPVWINPPAKVTRQRIVEQIVVSLYDLDISKEDVTGRYDIFRTCFNELDQVIVTPGNYKVGVTEINSTQSRIELLDSYGRPDPTLDWTALFTSYGTIDPTTTTLRLKTADEIEDTSGDILGSLEASTTESNIAIFTVDEDSLPQTLPSGPVLDIIDPVRTYPGNGLPNASPGQRYLLLNNMYTDGEEPAIPEDIPPGSTIWGGVVAYENDIIEFNGTEWVVVFDSREAAFPQYVKSIANGQHYKFNGETWIYTYLGEYNPGYWRIAM